MKVNAAFIFVAPEVDYIKHRTGWIPQWYI